MESKRLPKSMKRNQQKLSKNIFFVNVIRVFRAPTQFQTPTRQVSKIKLENPTDLTSIFYSFWTGFEVQVGAKLGAKLRTKLDQRIGLMGRPKAEKKSPSLPLPNSFPFAHNHPTETQNPSLSQRFPSSTTSFQKSTTPKNRAPQIPPPPLQKNPPPKPKIRHSTKKSTIPKTCHPLQQKFTTPKNCRPMQKHPPPQKVAAKMCHQHLLQKSAVKSSTKCRVTINNQTLRRESAPKSRHQIPFSHALAKSTPKYAIQLHAKIHHLTSQRRVLFFMTDQI